MKAAIFNNYGAANVLQVQEVDKPVPKSNEILVKVKAASVNSGDVRIRKADPWMARLAFGLFKPRIKILGICFSGVVESVGTEVTKYKIGDEVFGLSLPKMGSYAEYLTISQDSPITLKPANVSFEDAAAVTFGAHTALHFLKKAELKQAQTILIYGASGAVGAAAIQLAKYYGSIVTAVTSSGNLELCTSLGADSVIDYTKTDITNMTEKYDVVYETVDKTKVNQISQLVKKGGTLILGAVIIKGAIIGAWEARKNGFKLIAGVANVTAQDMDFIAKLTAEGVLKPAIDEVYPLDQIVEAHAYVDTGHKKGNVVVRIQ